MNHTVPRRRVLWCRITGRHRGFFGYFAHSGPYWMCENCQDTIRFPPEPEYMG